MARGIRSKSGTRRSPRKRGKHKVPSLVKLIAFLAITLTGGYRWNALNNNGDEQGNSKETTLAGKAPAFVAKNLAKGDYSKKTVQSIKVTSWNVENLFDTKRSEDTDDDEFTPASINAWTHVRYHKKLSNLSEVIISLNPDILCLIEVENLRVLNDLNTAILTQNGIPYPYILHQNSSDPRGIDVAILSRFPFSKTDYLKGPRRGLRDSPIAHVRVNDADILIIGNHWKAESGKTKQDQAENLAKRNEEAIALHKRLNQLRQQSPDLPILVMGDFNTAFDSPTLTAKLGSTTSRTKALQNPSTLLYSLSAAVTDKKRQTYYYHPMKAWSTIDSISISPNLLTDFTTTTTVRQESSRKIKPAKWVVDEATYGATHHPKYTLTVKGAKGKIENGVPMSFRYIRGNASKGQKGYYQEGSSDHLPISVTLYPRQ